MRFAIDEQVTFAEEPESPYTIQAIGKRYAVLTRPATDDDAESFEYERNLDGAVVYTIIDRETMMRGPNYFVFNPYDYESREGCEQCLDDLEGGQADVSQRRGIPVMLVDDGD